MNITARGKRRSLVATKGPIRAEKAIFVSSIFLFGFLILNGLISAPPAIGATPWQSEWERTVTAAKKEGQVSIYGAASQGFLAVNAGVFQKTFPEIKIVQIGGSSALPRILAERRAGKYLADVVVGGTATTYGLYQARALGSIKDAMILPEVIDESKWWQGKHHFSDPERKHAFSYIGHPETGGFYYNTQLVDPKEFQSFWDFLNPKWKGKIASRDIRTSGTGNANMRGFYHNPKVGPEWIRRLYSEMDITLFRDARQGVNWLVTGKFSLCFFCSKVEVGLARRQGLPIDSLGALKEGQSLTASSGSVGLVDKAPHPNAARVFINWLLSREGQLTAQNEYVKARVGASNSLRIDIPKDMIPFDERLQEGVVYILTDTPETISSEPMIKLVNEALSMAKR
jgi:iron(III) transport system substrate-binding protein